MRGQENVGKLPAWAQYRIANLEKALEDAKMNILAMRQDRYASGIKDPHMRLSSYDDTAPLLIGPYNFLEIDFSAGSRDPRPPVEAMRASLRLYDGQYVVEVHYNGPRQMVVLPQVTNVVQIGVREWPTRKSK